MKKLLNVVLVLLLTVTLVGFAGASFASQSIDKVSEIVTADKNTIESTITETVNQVAYEVPVEYRETINKVIGSVVESKEGKALMAQYGEKFVNDMVNGVADGAASIDADVQALLSKYNKEIKAAMGDTIPEGQKDTVIQEVVTKVRLETRYKDVVNKVQGSLSPSQQELVQKVGYLVSNKSMLLNVALVSVVVLSVLVLMFNFVNRKWFKYSATALLIAGVVVFITYIAMPFVLNQVLTKLPMKIAVTALPVDALRNFGLVYVGLGIVFIVAHKLWNRQHFAA